MIEAKCRKRKSSERIKKEQFLEIEDDTGSIDAVKETFKKVRNGKFQPISVIEKNQFQDIPQIPSINLSFEEMQQDLVGMIDRLQQMYHQFGAVKLTSCKQWQPPFCFKYTENKMVTRVQKIHRLLEGKPFGVGKNQYSIKDFQNMAEDFQNHYKFKYPQVGSSKEAKFQNQYWSIVNRTNFQDLAVKQKNKTRVQYAADLPVLKNGSGFPQVTSHKTQLFNYGSSLFNLNNCYKSPHSLMNIMQTYNQNISGVTVPWVYMGMQFSTFCWHVEDLWLHSVNYSHKGATKIWYVIPESDKEKFDNFVRQKGHFNQLEKITLAIDPRQVRKAGIKVYKAYQRPKDYILTLFKAYHCGFSTGFNVGQAVNLTYLHSLTAIRDAIKYEECHRKKPLVLGYDWLIYRNYHHNNGQNAALFYKHYSKLAAEQLATVRQALKRCKVKQMVVIDEPVKLDKLICDVCRGYQYVSCFKCCCCQKIYCCRDVSSCCGHMIFLTRQKDGIRNKTIEYIEENMK